MHTHVTIKSGPGPGMKIYDESSKLNVDGMSLTRFSSKILLLIRIFGSNVATIQTIPSST